MMKILFATSISGYLVLVQPDIRCQVSRYGLTLPKTRAIINVIQVCTKSMPGGSRGQGSRSCQGPGWKIATGKRAF